MTQYLVTWKIDTESDDPRAAAWEALFAMQVPTEATYFEVTEKKTGKVTEVDLDFVAAGWIPPTTPHPSNARSEE